MNTDIIQRIDAFAYRHRLADVMRSPVLTIAAAASLKEAAVTLAANRVGALAVLDDCGRPIGLITEREIAHAAAEPGRLGESVGTRMSGTVATLPPDAFVFAALTELRRHGARHLVVTDPATARALGVVSMSALLKLRADEALLLSADASLAPDAQSLGEVVEALPRLATALLAEGIPAREIAAALAAIIRDVYARAGVLAESLVQATAGPAPARWCFLVLGSAGRGESLLAADQDHALVHDGGADDDPWFSEFGRHCAAILDEAGIPFCRGDVMASNRQCRHNLSGWRQRIALWVGSDDEVALLNADIFFDFRPVLGDFALAAELRRASHELGRAPLFLRRLAAAIGSTEQAFSIFGTMKAKGGRVNLKRGALLPIVCGARVLALSLGSDALESARRWEAARAAGLVSADDFARINDAHDMALRLMLSQQLADLARGRAPGAEVELKRLLEFDQERMKAGLRIAAVIETIVRGALV
jgi:signal-transduction protein with cAMP-binding, CBS, and nucleotidyltransferase domain